MLKKTAIILLVVLALFLAAGCGAENRSGAGNNAAAENTETNTAEPQPADDKTHTSINGIEFALDKDTSYNGLGYTVSEGFKEVEQSRYVQYNYNMEDGSNLFFFRVFYYKAGGIEAAIKELGLDSGIVLTDGKTDSIAYKFYEKPRDDGGTIHFYFIEHEGSTYAINVICKYDIKDFEEKAVKSLHFVQ